MCTNLDRKYIIKGIKWAMKNATETNKKRKKYQETLCVEKSCLQKQKRTDTQDPIKWGIGYNDENTITITYQNLLDIVELDLEYSYSTIGDSIFKQTEGCPIGGILMEYTQTLHVPTTSILTYKH